MECGVSLHGHYPQVYSVPERFYLLGSNLSNQIDTLQTRVRQKFCNILVWIGFVSLFNVITTFEGYLKPSSLYYY